MFFFTSARAQEVVQERADWQKFFSDFKAEGTIVIADERESSRATWVFNPERAKKPYSPASTYKIPHTLFALDSGAVRDEFQIFKWDGVQRSFAAHNQDQNLRSAMRNSTMWVYEIFAKDIGEKKAKRYLQKIDYGNADPPLLRAIIGWMVICKLLRMNRYSFSKSSIAMNCHSSLNTSDCLKM